VCPSRSLWRRALQDRVSQNNTRTARPRPRPQRARPRPRPRPIFWSQAGLAQGRLSTSCNEPMNLTAHCSWYSNGLGLALRPTVSDHITVPYKNSPSWCSFYLLSVIRFSASSCTTFGFKIRELWISSCDNSNLSNFWCSSVLYKCIHRKDRNTRNNAVFEFRGCNALW